MNGMQRFDVVELSASELLDVSGGAQEPWSATATLRAIEPWTATAVE